LKFQALSWVGTAIAYSVDQADIRQQSLPRWLGLFEAANEFKRQKEGVYEC
jgi:hypothetical protein